MDTAERLGLNVPVTLQPQYNLLVREIEWEIVPACESTGLGLLPWSPLGGGWLTGKYKRDSAPTGATRLGENPNRGQESYGPRNASERVWKIIETLEKIAKGRGISMAEVALSWLNERPAVTSVILGARTVEQLSQNLKADGLKLSADEVTALDTASAPAVGDYPYGPGGTSQRTRPIKGGRATAG